MRAVGGGDWERSCDVRLPGTRLIWPAFVQSKHWVTPVSPECYKIHPQGTKLAPTTFLLPQLPEPRKPHDSSIPHIPCAYRTLFVNI